MGTDCGWYGLRVHVPNHVRVSVRQDRPPQRLDYAPIEMDHVGRSWNERGGTENVRGIDVHRSDGKHGVIAQMDELRSARMVLRECTALEIALAVIFDEGIGGK